LLQLFTIGTVMLNLDGTPQVDEHRQPIPTYEQSQIEELARVFTGWTYPVPPGQPRGHPYFVGQMVAYEWRHDTDPKVLFGQTLPAGQTALEDLDQALDIIFNHPNVPPFVALRLIQHFVSSNPTPNYVERVARVFMDNGQGVRGDMFAVVKAVLLDPEARKGDDDIATQPRTGGHLREPFLYVTGMLRALQARVDFQNGLWTWYGTVMGEKVYFPPSV